MRAVAPASCSEVPHLLAESNLGVDPGGLVAQGAGGGSGRQERVEVGEEGGSNELYSMSMTTRIGPKGQVVIPKELRDKARLHPGDEVDIEMRGDVLVLTPRREPRGLAGRFDRSGMAGRLLTDRAAEPR